MFITSNVTKDEQRLVMRLQTVVVVVVVVVVADYCLTVGNVMCN